MTRRQVWDGADAKDSRNPKWFVYEEGQCLMVTWSKNGGWLEENVLQHGVSMMRNITLLAGLLGKYTVSPKMF